MFQGIYKNKKVLVTGHTGFKGSWLCEWLLNLGADVSGYSLYIPSTPSNFEVLNLRDRMNHIEGDIRDLAHFKKVLNDVNPDMVFHLAAQAIVSRSYDDPRLTFETNLMGMVNVLEGFREALSVKAAVLITSDKCYENVEWEHGYRETDRLGGKDPYSASKACAEIAFSSYARSFFGKSETCRIATTRAGNVIGGGDWAKDRIVPDCVRAWSGGESALIRNPKSTRPWQHVLEPLSGYLALGASLWQQNADVVGESFNLGPPADVNQPVSSLIVEILKTWGNSQWHVDPHYQEQKKEAGLLKLSCDKALARLNWKPTLGFAETARFTASWYQNYYQNKSVEMTAFTRQQIQEYQDLARERGILWAKS